MVLGGLLQLITLNIHAQNLDSTNYTLLGPTMDSGAGITNSANYSNLVGTSPIDQYTIISTNYSLRGGTATFIEAYVPTIICLETSTTTGTTNCTGVPGGNGMQGVCSSPGCYDRAKIEINTQGNAADARFAIQISTTSDFSSNIQYITGATRIPKNTLAVSDFLFKCEWEGTISVGYCGAANTTWQKYNILGLNPGTTYYMRVAGLKGSSTDGSFTQSAWGPSVSVSTQNTSISFDVDIATSTAGSSSQPYIINVLNIIPDTVYTSTDYIIFRSTTNALNGMRLLIKGNNGYLENVANAQNIPSANGDLASQSEGWGLRNDSTTNSQINGGYLGTITVSSSPTDFTDTGATHRIGGITTSFIKLFDSNTLPLNTGVSGYKVKVKTDYSKKPGTYSDILTVIPVGSF